MQQMRRDINPFNTLTLECNHRYILYTVPYAFPKLLERRIS